MASMEGVVRWSWNVLLYYKRRGTGGELRQEDKKKGVCAAKGWKATLYASDLMDYNDSI